MFCPKCGKINPDDAQLCSGCGASLQDEGKAKLPEKKKSRFKLVLAVLALLIIACVVVFLLNGCTVMEMPPEKMTF